MIFNYADRPHERRHGPRGYANYQQFKPWLRDEFTFRCVLCLRRERWTSDGQAAFGVDHFVPQSLAPDRVCDYSNLLYLCLRCNSAKGNRIPAIDPCRDDLGTHLDVRDDGTVIGLTAAGNDVIETLQLDHPRLTEFRRRMLAIVRLLRDSSHPDAALALQGYLGFPDDLPNLRSLRPPGGNSRPEGIDRSFHTLRGRGLLPESY